MIDKINVMFSMKPPKLSQNLILVVNLEGFYNLDLCSQLRHPDVKVRQMSIINVEVFLPRLHDQRFCRMNRYRSYLYKSNLIINPALRFSECPGIHFR